MDNHLDLLQKMDTSKFLWRILRGLLPSFLINIVCMLIIYSLLAPHFSSSSIIPLLAASIFPILGNFISFLRYRRLDIIGITILFGLLVSIIAIMLGGGPQLLLIRESFTTGAIGLLLLGSLIFPKPLGYYFARHFLSGGKLAEMTNFSELWQISFFRNSLRGGTVFWGILLVGEFILRILIVFTLPTVFVLAFSPILFNGFIIIGIMVSAIWAKSMYSRLRKMGQAQPAF